MVDFQKPYFVDPTIQYPAEEKMLSSPNDVPGDHLLKNRSKQAPIRTFGDIIKALNLLGFNHRTSTGGSGGGGPQGEVGPAGGVLVEDYVADLNSGTYPTGSSVQVLDYSADVSGGGGLFNVYDSLPNGWTQADNQWFCFHTANGKYAIRQVGATIDIREFGVIPVDIYNTGFDLTHPSGWELEDTEARNLFTSADIGKTVYIQGARTDGATHGRATVAGIIDSNTVSLTSVSLQQVASDTEIRIGNAYTYPSFEALRRWCFYNRLPFKLYFPAGEYNIDWNGGGSPWPAAPNVTIEAKNVTMVGSYRFHGHAGVANPDMFGSEFGRGAGFFFHYGHSIDTLDPHTHTVTFKTSGAAAKYRIGDRVLISSRDQFGFGFPPDMAFFHYDVVSAVDVGANTITIKDGDVWRYEEQLSGNLYTDGLLPGNDVYGYFDPTQPGTQIHPSTSLLQYTEVGLDYCPNGGPAHCLNMDRRDEFGIPGCDFVWGGVLKIVGLKCENVWDDAVRGMTVLLGDTEQVELENVDFPATSLQTVRSFRAKASHLGDLQTDKLVASVTIDDDCHVTNSTHSTGVNYFRMSGGSLRGTSVNAKHVDMRGVRLSLLGGISNARMQTARYSDCRLHDQGGSGGIGAITPEFDALLDRENGTKLRVQAILNGYNKLLLVPGDGGAASLPLSAWSAGTYTYGEIVLEAGAYYRVNTASTTDQPGASSDWTLEELPLNYVAYYSGAYHRAKVDNPVTLPSDTSSWEALTVSGQSSYQTSLVGVQQGIRCCRIDDSGAAYLAPLIDNEGYVNRVQYQDVRGGALWVTVDCPDQFTVGDKIMFLAADARGDNLQIVPGTRDPAQVGSNLQSGMQMRKIGETGDSYIFKARIGPFNLTNVDSSGVVAAWPNVNAASGSGATISFYARGFFKKFTFNVLKAYGGATGTVTAVTQTFAGATSMGPTFNLKTTGARTLTAGVWSGAVSGDTLSDIITDGVYAWGPAFGFTQLTSEDINDLPVIEITLELYKKKPSL